MNGVSLQTIFPIPTRMGTELGVSATLYRRNREPSKRNCGICQFPREDTIGESARGRRERREGPLPRLSVQATDRLDGAEIFRPRPGTSRPSSEVEPSPFSGDTFSHGGLPIGKGTCLDVILDPQRQRRRQSGDRTRISKPYYRQTEMAPASETERGRNANQQTILPPDRNGQREGKVPKAKIIYISFGHGGGGFTQ